MEKGKKEMLELGWLVEIGVYLKTIGEVGGKLNKNCSYSKYASVQVRPKYIKNVPVLLRTHQEVT